MAEIQEEARAQAAEEQRLKQEQEEREEAERLAAEQALVQQEPERGELSITATSTTADGQKIYGKRGG